MNDQMQYYWNHDEKKDRYKTSLNTSQSLPIFLRFQIKDGDKIKYILGACLVLQAKELTKCDSNNDEILQFYLGMFFFWTIHHLMSYHDNLGRCIRHYLKNGVKT